MAYDYMTCCCMAFHHMTYCIAFYRLSLIHYIWPFTIWPVSIWPADRLSLSTVDASASDYSHQLTISFKFVIRSRPKRLPILLFPLFTPNGRVASIRPFPIFSLRSINIVYILIMARRMPSRFLFAALI